MRVSDVMDTRVDVADACMNAQEAWDQMRQHDLASLIVTDAGRIVGIVDSSRLGGPDGSVNRLGRTLAEFLPSDPIAIPSEYPIARAAELLEGGVSGCVAVLHHGRLVGVLTMSGLLNRLAAREARSRAS